MTANTGGAKPGLRSRLGNTLRAGGVFSTSIYFNYLWSVLNLGLGKGLRLVGIALCVRQMGVQSWGQLAAAVAGLGLIGLLVSQGLAGLPQIFHVNDRTLDRPLLRKICLYRLAAALLVIATLYVLRLVIPVNDVMVAYSWFLIPMALNFEWLFHRRERYHLSLFINVVKAVAFFLQVVLFIGPESTPFAVVRIEIVAETCGLLFSLLLVKRAGLHGSLPGGTLAWGVLLAGALPLFLSEILQVLPVTVNLLFLKALWGYEVVAQYDIGARIGTAYFFLGAALVQIVLPKLSRLHMAGDQERMGKVLAAASAVLLVLGTLLLLPSFYFAPEITRWMFDKDYPAVILVFQWIPVWVYASFMTMLNTIVLLAAGMRREYFYGALLATSANLLANWILIAHFSVAGAIAARLVSEAVFFVYAAIWIPREVKVGYGREIATQAGLLGTLVLLFLASDMLSRPLCLALSVGVCTVVFWRRGIFSRETFRVLRTN